MGGVASVCTRPEARRQGLSTRLLQDAIRLMENEGMPVSLLQTGIHDHYHRLGWEQVSLYWKTLRVDRGLRGGFEVRPLQFAPRSGSHSPGDIPALARIFRTYQRKFNGGMVRHIEDWQKFTLAPMAGEPPNRWWGAEVEGRLLAYLCLEKQDDRLIVQEFGALPEGEALFDPLAAQVLERLNLPNQTVACPGMVLSRFEIAEWNEHGHWMARLNLPFELDGCRVETTPGLVACLRGPDPAPAANQYFFWENDGF
jgi:hypothetical protein